MQRFLVVRGNPPQELHQIVRRCIVTRNLLPIIGWAGLTTGRTLGALDSQCKAQNVADCAITTQFAHLYELAATTNLRPRPIRDQFRWRPPSVHPLAWTKRISSRSSLKLPPVDNLIAFSIVRRLTCRVCERSANLLEGLSSKEDNILSKSRVGS